MPESRQNYDLIPRRVERVAALRTQSGVYENLLRTDIAVKNRATGSITGFSITYGAEGPMAGVPIAAKYQPNWWFKERLEFSSDRSIQVVIGYGLVAYGLLYPVLALAGGHDSIRGCPRNHSVHERPDIMAHTIKRILVPVDFSAASRAALWRAGELATALGATIELLHVVDLPQPPHVISEGHVPLPPEYRQEVMRSAEDHFKDWLDTAKISAPIHRVLGEGKPFVEIVKYAREHAVDLIVMGTHGRGGMSHLLLGSVADRVTRTAPCPVMTVRADDHPATSVPGLD